MLKRRKKIRERKESRFSPGIYATILGLIASGIYGLNIGMGQRLRNELSEALGLGEFSAVIIIITIILAFFAAALILAKRSKKRLQILRNAEINLSATNALFLRPLFSDKKMFFLNPFHSIWWGGMSLETPVILPEEFVSRVLEPFINVWQFGGSDATIGGGRVAVLDEEWRDAVEEAISKATITIIMPIVDRDKKTGCTLGAGTISELEYL